MKKRPRGGHSTTGKAPSRFRADRATSIGSGAAHAGDVDWEATAARLERENAALRAALSELGPMEGEHAEAWQARLRQARWLDTVFQTVPVAMSFIDRDLRYLKVNEGTAALTGVPVAGHAGRTLREVNPALTDEMESLIRGVIASGTSRLCHPLSRVTPHAKGGSVELLMQVLPLVEPDGSIAGACVTATDVTEWKQLQDLLARAQRLSSCGEVAAGIAHDFNNLLTIIAGNCEILLMELPDTSPLREDIDAINQTARRAATLARRMLAISRNHVFDPERVALRAAIENARDLLIHARRRAVTVETEVAADACDLFIDAMQFEQVLLNIVVNAIDATPDGGRVTVKAQPVDVAETRLVRTGELAAGRYALISIADNGSGMDALTVARIFEPFFTTKAEGRGTGLGLAMAFSMIRAMGGAIDVQTNVGAGTRFDLFLPAMEPDGDASQSVEPAGSVRHLHGRETVLVVDDEDLIRAAIARVLRKHGYDAIEAGHGGEALRMLATRADVALIVSDLHMPGIDGIDLATRLRASGRHTPTLFLSGSSGGPGAAEHPDLRPGLVRDVDRFLPKPVAVRALLRTVRDLLDAATAGSPPGS